jgi:hypothetical protein
VPVLQYSYCMRFESSLSLYQCTLLPIRTVLQYSYCMRFESSLSLYQCTLLPICTVSTTVKAMCQYRSTVTVSIPILLSTPLLTSIMALSPIGSFSILSRCSCSSARREAITSLKVDHRNCNFVLNHSSCWLHFLMNSIVAVSHKLPRHRSPDTAVSSVSRPKHQQCLCTAHSLLSVCLSHCTVLEFVQTIFFFLLWRCHPMASPVLRFLDHTQRRTTVGRSPLDE